VKGEALGPPVGMLMGFCVGQEVDPEVGAGICPEGGEEVGTAGWGKGTTPFVGLAEVGERMGAKVGVNEGLLVPAIIDIVISLLSWGTASK